MWCIKMVKIENYEVTADTFTFTNPPDVFDDAGEANSSAITVPYFSEHVHIGAGGVKPKVLVITGRISGATRNAEFRELCKHFLLEDQKLKKFYFEDDKFYLGHGITCRKTNSGEAVGFINYVATFKVLLPVVFSNTQKVANSGSAETNQGNLYTYVEEVSGQVANGSVDVTITDSFGYIITIPSSKINTNDNLVIKLVSMKSVGGGVKYTFYNYLTINATETNGLKDNRYGALKMEEGDVAGGGGSPDIVPTNLNSWSIKFRDGYAA